MQDCVTVWELCFVPDYTEACVGKQTGLSVCNDCVSVQSLWEKERCLQEKILLCLFPQ